MSKFREVARKVNSSSEVTLDRTKVKIDEIADVHDPMTIIAFDVFEKTDYKKMADGSLAEVTDRFGVFNIAEDDGIYFFGCAALNRIIFAWLEDYGYDVKQSPKTDYNKEAITSCVNDLRSEGGIQVSLIPGRKTKDGNTFTEVFII